LRNNNIGESWNLKNDGSSYSQSPLSHQSIGVQVGLECTPEYQYIPVMEIVDCRANGEAWDLRVSLGLTQDVLA